MKHWISFPRTAGTWSRQAHCDLPEGSYEREFGKEGFFGPVSHIHHAHMPTGWTTWKGVLRPRAFDTTTLQSDASCPLQAAVLLHNAHFSLAIMEYLDERYPNRPLLPRGPLARARVRALAQAIACEIAPLNNLRVRNYLTQEMGSNDAQSLAWTRHWIAIGFNAVEAMLQQPHTGVYCDGDQPTLADCCLVPQVYNARRFECDLTPYPQICRITAACESLQAFVDAHPDAQPDAGGG
jgi:maleylacetoacetate isomerase